MFEYAVMHTLARRLRPGNAAETQKGQRKSLRSLSDEVSTVLSAVAWSGSEGDPAAASQSFSAGIRMLPEPFEHLTMAEASAITLDRIDEALSALERASPAAQRAFLKACAAAASSDRTMKAVEIELLRAIAEALDCPMPPLPAA